ncbi:MULTISPECIES: hypothetical protein [Marinobacter]|jgi:hypothetical protein|uniref:hypothetical protein n=1 Tax=Marinobacter TaxID=2742 RepID=UPI0022B20C27|nr:MULTISPECIES: hypothetical protein [Marinobacter]MCZ4284559.1 hypothetical protein [Marinobacter salarius]|tara:strand:- start:4670 stop:4879 length:210 start_codon:yes stop_codon:yes gene_type:complete
MPDFLKRHRLIPRLVLIWACVLISIVVLRVTEPEVMEVIGGGAVATIVTGVIGILATVITLYRSKPSDQ